MGTGLVDGSYEQANTEGSLRWMEGLCLRFLADDRDQPFTWVLRSVHILEVEAGVSHELGQETSISSHS